MREIEFRIYDKELEKMIYLDDEDYDYRPPLTFRLEQVFRKDNNYNDYEDFEWSDISDRVEIMQYTGLKDKNGKKIFEGDIVKIHRHSFDFGFEKDKIGQIKFINGAFGFYISQNENEYIFNELSVELSYGELDYYEVIGSIYDNPELLKEKL